MTEPKKDLSDLGIFRAVHDFCTGFCAAVNAHTVPSCPSESCPPWPWHNGTAQAQARTDAPQDPDLNPGKAAELFKNHFQDRGNCE